MPSAADKEARPELFPCFGVAASPSHRNAGFYPGEAWRVLSSIQPSVIDPAIDYVLNSGLHSVLSLSPPSARLAPGLLRCARPVALNDVVEVAKVVGADDGP